MHRISKPGTRRGGGGFMRSTMSLAIAPLLAMLSAGASNAQITSNPIPTPIEKHGLAVEIKDLVHLPDTRALRPADQDLSPAGWAPATYVRALSDSPHFATDPH